MKITRFNSKLWHRSPKYQTAVTKQINDNLNKYYNSGKASDKRGTYDSYRVVPWSNDDEHYNEKGLNLGSSKNCFKIEHSYRNNYGYNHTITINNVPTHFVLNMSKFTLAKRDKLLQHKLIQKFGYHHLKSGKMTKNPTFSLAKGAHAGLSGDDTSRLVHNNPYCSCNKNGKKIPFHMSYSDIGEETGCPINHLQKAISNGERITQNFLKRNGISYMYGHRLNVHGYDKNGGPTNGHLHADFFIPHQATGAKHDIMIEIDGSQHNYSTYLGGIKGALHQEHNGRIKDVYCRNHRPPIDVVHVPESAIYNNYFQKHFHNTFNRPMNIANAQKDEITQILDKELLPKLNTNKMYHASNHRIVKKHHLQKLFGKELNSKSYFLARPKQVKKGQKFFNANQRFGNDLTAVSNHNPKSILNYNEHLRHDEQNMDFKHLYSKNFNEVKSLMRSDSYDIPSSAKVNLNSSLLSKTFKQPYTKKDLKTVGKMFKTLKHDKENNMTDIVNNNHINNDSLLDKFTHHLRGITNKFRSFSKNIINQRFNSTQPKAKKHISMGDSKSLNQRIKREERNLTSFTR